MKDTTVKCMDCGKKKKVNFAVSMKSGWPFCCRETMHLVDSDVNIQDELKKIYRYGNRNFTVKR